MIKNKIIILIFILYSQINLASENMVAQIILMRGQAKGKTTDGHVFEIKLDQKIAEGTIIQTAEKSFVKLLFIDKSQLNLGPQSQMVINTFPKNDPGIISLIKGQIRLKVTKDYMEMNDKSKSKLYIKTASAAMGIRGTDFQVNYNNENHNTSLITFEGAVAMANIARNEQNNSFEQHQLEHLVSSDKAVMVKEGQISAVNFNISELAMVPTKLGTGQISALKENESGLKKSTDKELNSDNKTARSPIPPGIDGEILSKNNQSGNQDPTRSANGFFNQSTGEYKLPAGSIIDLNSVNIIPPPLNAVYDPNSQMYVVPNNYGKVDTSTGEYKAPPGLKLGNDGKFQELPSKERGPASEKAPLPNIFTTRPEMAQFTDSFGQGNDKSPPNAPQTSEQLKNIANERINTTETLRNNATNSGALIPTSRIKFIFNVK